MKQFSGLSRTIQGNHLLDTCAIDILKIGHRPLVLCAKQEYNTTVESFVKVLTCHGLIVKIAYMEEWDQNSVEEYGKLVSDIVQTILLALVIVLWQLVQRLLQIY